MAPKPFESRIQDLVYNVDVGIGLSLIKFGLYLLGVLIVMLLFTVTQFKGLRDAEAMDYAQLGRNLLYHKAFVTQCIRPASMWYMIENSPDHNPRIERHPDILHPPVYPAVLAAGYKLTGAAFSVDKGARSYPPERWVIIPVGHLFTLLSALFVLLFGQHLFNRKIGFLGATVYFLSDQVWRDSIAGLGVPLLTFLVLVACYTALVAVGREREGLRGTRWMPLLVLSALASITACLTRYPAWVIVPAIALLLGVSLKRRGWIAAAVYIAIFMVGLFPWVVRNVAVSGGPFGLAPYTALQDTNIFADDTFMRTLAPTIQFGAAMRALWQKWLVNMARYYQDHLWTVGDGLLMCLFVTTFFYKFSRFNVHVFRWCLALGMILLTCVAGLFGDAVMSLMSVFWPFVLLYSLAFFFILLERLQLRIRLWNLAATVLLVLLTALPLIFSLLPPRAGTPYPPYFQPYIRHVSAMLKPNELMCTDMPWATAWYGQRNSLQMPITIDDFYEINDYNKRISGLYVTTITRNKPFVRSLLTGADSTWFPILEGRIPGDFPLTQGFPIGNRDQIFLTDRARWME